MKKYITALKSLNAKQIFEASRKEASRQVGEMETWMKKQKTMFPDELSTEIYEEEGGVFEKIRNARKYLNNLHTRTKTKKLLDNEAIEGGMALYTERGETIILNAKEWKANRKLHSKAEDEQWGYAWRIMKIYCFVRNEVMYVIGSDDDNSFKEFEYDPERYG